LLPLATPKDSSEAFKFYWSNFSWRKQCFEYGKQILVCLYASSGREGFCYRFM